MNGRRWIVRKGWWTFGPPMSLSDALAVAKKQLRGSNEPVSIEPVTVTRHPGIPKMGSEIDQLSDLLAIARRGLLDAEKQLASPGSAPWALGNVRCAVEGLNKAIDGAHP